MVKTKKTEKPKGPKVVLPAWKKTKTGVVYAAHPSGKAEFKLVPKPECKDWYWLLLNGEKRAEGTKQFCKDAAARVWGRVGTSNPLGVSVGITRKKLEDPEDFFVRAAVEYGYRPHFLAGCEYVMREARIDKGVLTPEFLRDVTEKSWGLYRDKLEQAAERSHYAGSLRKVLGLPKDASLMTRDRAFQEDVERERKTWFRVPGAADEDLEALAALARRRRGDGKPADEPAETPAPEARPKVRGRGVERDEWGYPAASKAGRINAAVTAEPKTAKRVATDAGVVNAASHLATLVKKGLVKKLPDGTYRRRRLKQKS